MNDSHSFQILSKDSSTKDFVFKLVLAGDSGVGKTTLAKQIAFNSPNTNTNNLMEMYWNNYQVDDYKLCLQIWDTICDDNFECIYSLFYKSAACIFLVFDLNSNKSFLNIHKWMLNIQQYISQDTLLILVGNKFDLNSNVNTTDIQKVAEDNNFDSFFLISAKDNLNVSDLLQFTLFTLIDMYTSTDGNESDNKQKELLSNSDNNPNFNENRSNNSSTISINIRKSISSVQKQTINLHSHKQRIKCYNCQC